MVVFLSRITILRFRFVNLGAGVWFVKTPPTETKNNPEESAVKFKKVVIISHLSEVNYSGSS